MMRIIFLCVFLVLASCKGKYLIEEPPQLVVEGWIDANGFPVVILTETLPISEDEISVLTLEEHLIKWAKVTVCDGEREVVLNGKVDKKYFPPYIYTTSHMRGIPGKKYKLTVSYEDYYAEAETIIPQPVEIDSFSVHSINGSGGYYQVVAHISDNPDENNYYKAFSYASTSKYTSYTGTYMGIVNDAVLDEHVCLSIYRSRTIDNWENYEQYFTYGEKVMIKISQLDQIGYRFWEAYEVVSSLSRNPLFPVTEGLPSNVKGAMGYWLGYGSNQYLIEIKD